MIPFITFPLNWDIPISNDTSTFQSWIGNNNKNNLNCKGTVSNEVGFGFITEILRESRKSKGWEWFLQNSKATGNKWTEERWTPRHNIYLQLLALHLPKSPELPPKIWNIEIFPGWVGIVEKELEKSREINQNFSFTSSRTHTVQVSQILLIFKKMAWFLPQKLQIPTEKNSYQAFTHQFKENMDAVSKELQRKGSCHHGLFPKV